MIKPCEYFWTKWFTISQVDVAAHVFKVGCKFSQWCCWVCDWLGQSGLPEIK